MCFRRPGAGAHGRRTSSASPFPGTARARPSLGLERLRTLSLVRVVGTGVDLELAQLRATETVARQHPSNRLADDLRRPPLELFAQRSLLEPARVAGMAVVDLVVELLA